MLYLIANSVCVTDGSGCCTHRRTDRIHQDDTDAVAMDKKVADMTALERKQTYKWVSDHFVVIGNNQVYGYSDIILFVEGHASAACRRHIH